jgi:hypothetical protein
MKTKGDVDDYGKPFLDSNGRKIGYRQLTTRELARAQVVQFLNCVIFSKHKKGVS